jgi:uncharacterized Zn finger protein (UPF0148 family)
MLMVRPPVILDDRGGAKTCSACMVKWARKQVDGRAYCPTCAKKEEAKQ